MGGERLEIAGPDGVLASASLPELVEAFVPTLERLVHGQAATEELHEG